MSYARWSTESNVYVFLSCDDAFECCSCSLYADITGGCQTANFRSTDGIIAHLLEHVRAGDKVPGYTFLALEEERQENDALWGICPGPPVDLGAPWR